MSTKTDIIDLPSPEDIDTWHDTGRIGDLYIWCQKMREIIAQNIEGKVNAE